MPHFDECKEQSFLLTIAYFVVPSDINYYLNDNNSDISTDSQSVYDNSVNSTSNFRGTAKERISEDNIEEGSLVIIDLGAGVLNMLRHVLMLSNDLIERGDDFNPVKIRF